MPRLATQACPKAVHLRTVAGSAPPQQQVLAVEERDLQAPAVLRRGRRRPGQDGHDGVQRAAAISVLSLGLRRLGTRIRRRHRRHDLRLELWL